MTMEKVNLVDKLTIALGGLTAVIAFAVLIFGDNVIKLVHTPDIYLNTEVVALERLGSYRGSVRAFNFHNAGSAASSNIKIVVRFGGGDLKYFAEGDEEIKSSAIKNSQIQISLDRFSSRSSIKLFVISDTDSHLLETYYVDDEGKTIIDPERKIINQEMWVRVCAIVLFVVLSFWFAISVLKRSEKKIANSLNSAKQGLDDKVDQLKSEVAELRGILEEKATMQAAADQNNNGAVDGLINFLNSRR